MQLIHKLFYIIDNLCLDWAKSRKQCQIMLDQFDADFKPMTCSFKWIVLSKETPPGTIFHCPCNKSGFRILQRSDWSQCLTLLLYIVKNGNYSKSSSPLWFQARYDAGSSNSSMVSRNMCVSIFLIDFTFTNFPWMGPLPP